jgi:hypothetical protein
MPDNNSLLDNIQPGFFSDWDVFLNNTHTDTINAGRGLLIELPPIGIVPRYIHQRNTDISRFNVVCGGIARMYNTNNPIPIEWVTEYNELLMNIQN